MPLRDAIQKILVLFFEIADGGGLLDERTEIFFHKSRDGGIPLGGDHAGPSVSFIINGNSDIFHNFTYLQLYKLILQLRPLRIGVLWLKKPIAEDGSFQRDPLYSHPCQCIDGPD